MAGQPSGSSIRTIILISRLRSTVGMLFMFDLAMIVPLEQRLGVLFWNAAACSEEL